MSATRTDSRQATGRVGRATALVVGASLAAALGPGCAGGVRRFALRAPLEGDTDLLPVEVSCRQEPTKKDPSHMSCAPEVYVSPLAWDGIDNSIFRPFSEVFAVESPGEAVNATSLDEVADSSWFTNRIGMHSMTDAEIAMGACAPSELLPDDAPDGSWVIDQGKENGSSLGFRVVVPGKGKFLFKTDDKAQPERATAASVIGAAAYHAVGFFTSCEQIVYFRPEMLRLKPGLRTTNNSGIERAFDDAALKRVLDAATHRGERIRMQASAWLPGHLIGPFRYEGTRSDDPNDVIPHEDRRELRGGRLLAAWLDHIDAREQNSMDIWFAAQPGAPPDASPGLVRHYYLDTSDCLGSEWEWDGISRRLGFSYVLDWGDVALDFVTLGIPQRRWDRVKRTVGREKFGYFRADDFDPEGWKNEYPNPAFSRMTERDGAWMARVLARFTPAMVKALAEAGELSDPADTEFLRGVLEARLQKILARYLTRLAPLTDVQVRGGSRLCAVDLAELSEVKPAAAFQYRATYDGATPLAVARSGAEICVNLPRVDAVDRGGDGQRAPYVEVSLEDGVARTPLRAFLYDLGPARGYVLAGLDRGEP